MKIIYQTDTILEETKAYGIGFFIEKDATDRTGISYKVVYGIMIYFNTKRYAIGIGVPKFKVTE